MRSAAWISLALAMVVAGAVCTVVLLRIPNMLEVDGTGTITVTPDRAHIAVGVVTRADQASDAAQQLATTMNQVIDALHHDGVPDADMTSGDLGTSTQENGDGKPPSYNATQTITVTVHDLAQLARLSTDVAAAGANQWSVSYDIADPSKLMAQARAAALADAQSTADQYAAQGSFKRGRVLKLLESEVRFPWADRTNRVYMLSSEATQPSPIGPRVFAAAAKAPSAGFTTLKPEPQTVTATVHVLFEIN